MPGGVSDQRLLAAEGELLEKAQDKPADPSAERLGSLQAYDTEPCQSQITLYERKLLS